MNNKTPKIDNKNKELDVSPSDSSQAILRFVIVSGLLVWSIFNTDEKSLRALSEQDFVLLTLVYWFFSIGFLLWTKRLNHSSDDILSLKYRITRIGAVVADIFAISAYTAIAGPHGLILYPIYLQTIIGHGYRFGLPYLYLSNTLGLIGFTAAVFYNRTFAEPSLVIAYYLGLLLVPLYALLLLRRHAEVQKKLRYVNDSRSRFIANMSHELRTPLHAILGLNEILREELVVRDGRDDGVAEKLRMVNDSAEHLLNLVNRVLEIASADQAIAKRPNTGPVNLREIISRATSISNGVAYSKGLYISKYISPEIPCVVESSGGLIEEALVNILGNAVKYTNKGGVYLYAGISNSKTILYIRVLDSGIGIKDDLLPTIFEPFTMGDDAFERQHTGTGLGLTITRQYIEILGGSVEIFSKSGIGTAVDIHLPIVEIDEPDTTKFSLKQALVLSPKALSASERLIFDHYNIDVVTASLGDAFDLDLENEKLDLILVASDYIKQQSELIKIKDATKHIPFFSYGSEIVSKPNFGEIPSIFLSAIRSGTKRDILASRFLLPNDEINEELGYLHDEIFNILVADDNEINVRTALLSLESAGHSVDTVSNGEAALDALSSKNYDLVFMDLHMPIMSGVEAATLYSYENENPAPIILLTADVTDEAKDACNEAGVTAILTKPVLPKELRAAVQTFARRESKNVQAMRDSKFIDQKSPEKAIVDSSLCDTKEIEELLDCGATKNELLEMIEIFENDSKTSVNLAIESAQVGRYSVVQSEMHSLKGAAGILGAKTLAEKARLLEYAPAARDGVDLNALRELIPLISDSSGALRKSITAENKSSIS